PFVRPPDASCRLKTAEIRHGDVHENHVRVRMVGFIDRLTPVVRLADDYDRRVLSKDGFDPLAEQGMVVAEQNFDLVSHCLQPKPAGPPQTARWPCATGPATADARRSRCRRLPSGAPASMRSGSRRLTARCARAWLRDRRPSLLCPICALRRTLCRRP